MLTKELKAKPPARREQVSSREDKVDPMWSLDEHERRIAFARRAAAGARKALGRK
jgi:hypothetical protein